MVPFSYLRRASGSSVLRRLLSLDERALPQTIKFVAARALNAEGHAPCDEWPVGTLECAQTRGRNRARGPGTSELAALIQEKVRHTGEDEWSPAAIISVVYFLSRVRAPLWPATRAIFSRKAAGADHLNLVDLWQTLAASRRLRVSVDVASLLRHLEANVDVLVAGASVRNVCSALNAFAACGAAVSAEALLRIAGHYRADMRRSASFKDATNIANAFALQLQLQLKLARRRAMGGREAATVTDPGGGTVDQVADTLDVLISDCLGMLGVASNASDLEGMADLCDSLALLHRWRGLGDPGGPRRLAQLEHLACAISRVLGGDECDYPDLLVPPSGGCEPGRVAAEPRLLRVVLRSLATAGLRHAGLLQRVIEIYRRSPSSWSAQGNAEVLRSLVFFGLSGPAGRAVAEHVAPRFQTDFQGHVDAGRVLIDACALAADAPGGDHSGACGRLVSSVLSCMDSIDTRSLALALLVLTLREGALPQLGLHTLRRVAARLHGSRVAVPVRACAASSSGVRDFCGADPVFHDSLASMCKLELNHRTD